MACVDRRRARVLMPHHNPEELLYGRYGGAHYRPVEYLAVLGLCILLSACAHTPVEQPPPQLFSHHLFAAPPERIRADDVFPLRDPLKHYLEPETAGRLLN